MPSRALCAKSYKVPFASFKQRADLYVVFIEHALSLLDQHGQLGFLCPGTWTRNVYGSAVRQAFTSLGQLKTIIDFSDAESFETSADAYPHFFCISEGPDTGRPEYVPWPGPIRSRRPGRPWSGHFSLRLLLLFLAAI